jgi:hypothetical protein
MTTTTTPRPTIDTETALGTAWATITELLNEQQAWPEQMRAAAEAGDAAALQALFSRRAALKNELTVAHLVARQRAVEHGMVLLQRAEAEVAAPREAGTAAYDDYNKGFGVPRDDQGNDIPPPPAMVAFQRAQQAVHDAQSHLKDALRMRETQFAAIAVGQ